MTPMSYHLSWLCPSNAILNGGSDCPTEKNSMDNSRIDRVSRHYVFYSVSSMWKNR